MYDLLKLINLNSEKYFPVAYYRYLKKHYKEIPVLFHIYRKVNNPQILQEVQNRCEPRKPNN